MFGPFLALWAASFVYNGVLKDQLEAQVLV